MVERIRDISEKWGPWPLFISALADASLLPMPVTTIFLILIAGNPKDAFKYTTFVILGTMAGSLAGYLFGHFAWLKENGENTALAQFIAGNIPGFSIDFYAKINTLFNKWDIWVLSIAATTPIPYGFFSIASGIFNINVLAFSTITLLSHSIKFIFLAFLTSRIRYESSRLKVFFLSKGMKGKTA